MMRAYLHIAIITINAVIVVISAYLNDSTDQIGILVGVHDICEQGNTFCQSWASILTSAGCLVQSCYCPVWALSKCMIVTPAAQVSVASPPRDKVGKQQLLNKTRNFFDKLNKFNYELKPEINMCKA